VVHGLILKAPPNNSCTGRSAHLRFAQLRIHAGEFGRSAAFWRETMKVYVLQHTNVINETEEDVKLIGVYSSNSEAKKAIDRKLRFPGFCDFPDGFHMNINLMKMRGLKAASL
jgi:hypothetical protein